MLAVFMLTVLANMTAAASMINAVDDNMTAGADMAQMMPECHQADEQADNDIADCCLHDQCTDCFSIHAFLLQIPATGQHLQASGRPVTDNPAPPAPSISSLYRPPIMV